MGPHIVPVDGIDLQATLAPLAMLSDDPTIRLAPGRFDRPPSRPTDRPSSP